MRYAWLFCSLWCSLLSAAPDMHRPVGPTIADTGSKWYHFVQQEFSSPAGHPYRLQIAIPNQAAPETGYPVIYLLDGNAAMADISEQLLGKLQQPPVIVTIGYQTEYRFDSLSRTRDYTPAGRDGTRQFGRWQGGGAEEFLTLLNQQIKPQIAALAPVNPKQQGIWGHSFGGLFVLYTLITAPDSFQFYAAADPALWWLDGAMLPRLAQFQQQANLSQKTQLLLMHGELKKQEHQGPASQAATLPDNIQQTIAQQLAQVPQLKVRYQGYPKLSHGPLFPVSLAEALQQFSASSQP